MDEDFWTDDDDEAPVPEDGLRSALFEGDEGTLYEDQRRCLHALLKHRYISADRHEDHWEVLLKDDQGVIKSRLNDLFLDLQIEWQQKIAFKRRVFRDTGEPLPSLLHDVSHTKEATIVMLALRQKYFAQRQEGDEAVYIDRQTMLEEIAEHWPETLTDLAAATKKAQRGIEGLDKAGVLIKADNQDDRFQISPIIEVLMPLEKLHELLAWLKAQNGASPANEADEELELNGLDEDEQGDPA